MTTNPLSPEFGIFVCGGGVILFAIIMAILSEIFRWRFGPSLLMTAGLMPLAASLFWPPMAVGTIPTVAYFVMIVCVCGAAVAWEGSLGNPAPMNYPRGR